MLRCDVEAVVAGQLYSWAALICTSFCVTESAAAMMEPRIWRIVSGWTPRKAQRLSLECVHMQVACGSSYHPCRGAVGTALGLHHSHEGRAVRRGRIQQDPIMTFQLRDPAAKQS